MTKKLAFLVALLASFTAHAAGQKVTAGSLHLVQNVSAPCLAAETCLWQDSDVLELHKSDGTNVALAFSSGRVQACPAAAT